MLKTLQEATNVLYMHEKIIEMTYEGHVIEMKYEMTNEGSVVVEDSSKNSQRVIYA